MIDGSDRSIPIGRWGVSRSGFALVGMYAFEVGEHDVTVQHMSMRGARVLDDGVGHDVLVIADESFAAPGAQLLVCHDRDRMQRSSRLGPARCLEGTSCALWFR